jgi:hypothetical protein
MRCQVFSFPLWLTMSIAPAWQQCLAFFCTPLVIESSPGQLSGDAGPLPIRQFASMTGKASKLVSRLTHKTSFDTTECTVNS